MTDVQEPLAITMWDSSWIRRRYAGGGFESFDQALDELKERGYNAVRIDAFPHMVAAAPDGTNAERFLDTPGVSWHKYGFAQWGNAWTVYIYPRRDLVDFIRKCEERGIYVALSSWLKPTWEHRNDYIRGAEDLIRIWDETLGFLQENDCLRNIIFVDVQNEIPSGACNTWLHYQLSCLGSYNAQGFNEKQTAFFTDYFKKVLRGLKAKWPQLSFTASVSWGWNIPSIDRMDFSDCDVLDVHMWAEGADCNFLKDTGYSEYIGRFGDSDRQYLNGNMNDYVGSGKKIPGDFYFEEMNEKILRSWQKNKAACREWLEEKTETVATVGKKFGIPYGNTEGWGTIIWLEHPMLTWDVVREAGEMAAEITAPKGYAFNCQSNFCEPQFLRLWRDVAYHRRVTDLIRRRIPSDGI